MDVLEDFLSDAVSSWKRHFAQQTKLELGAQTYLGPRNHHSIDSSNIKVQRDVSQYTQLCQS